MTLCSFQIIDIISDDIPIDNQKKFIISLYGINSLNERIICHIHKYTPYFFIKIPNDWDQPTGVKLIKNDICQLKPNHDKEGTIFNSVKNIKLILSNDFYGFYWNKNSQTVQNFKFLKIYFHNYSDMKKLILKIKEHYNLKDKDSKILTKTALNRLSQWRNVQTTSDCDCNLYESTIHPIIKFIHDTKIDPTGWIQCKLDKNSLSTILFH